MKKIFIFRFGATRPLPKEFPIMKAITVDSNLALGCDTPYGTLSIVLTGSSPAEILNLYQQVAEDTSDELPVIIWEEGQVVHSLDGQIFKTVEELNIEFDRLVGATPVNLTLDELLELISARGGVDKLSTSELERLKELTK